MDWRTLTGEPRRVHNRCGWTVKQFISALLAGVLTAAVGSPSLTGRFDERGHRHSHACPRADHRACDADRKPDGGMNERREPACEAVAGVDSSANSQFALASVLLVKASGRPTRRAGALASPSAFARPHDPLHLHAYSLLI